MKEAGTRNNFFFLLGLTVQYQNLKIDSEL